MMCDKKLKLPRNQIFSKLRDLWLLRNSDKTSKDLAALLDINPSNLSAYCSVQEENDRKQRICPDWCILFLLDNLDVRVSISSKFIHITSVDHIELANPTIVRGDNVGY